MAKVARALLLLVTLLALAIPTPVQAATSTNLMLSVPYRTQFDGSAYAGSNCGPSAIAMVLAAYGRDVPTQRLRDRANQLLGVYDPNSGTRIEDLAQIVREHGLTTVGPQNVKVTRRWTLEEARQELLAGRPVVALVYYPLLPNHPGGASTGHYIVLVGLAGEDFLFSDPATRDGSGSYVPITARQLERAWNYGRNPFSAFSVGPGPEDGSPPWPKGGPTGRFRAI